MRTESKFKVLRLCYFRDAFEQRLLLGFNRSDYSLQVREINHFAAGVQLRDATVGRKVAVAGYRTVGTGVMRCIAQPPRGSTTTKRASDSTNTNTP